MADTGAGAKSKAIVRPGPEVPDAFRLTIGIEAHPHKLTATVARSVALRIVSLVSAFMNWV